jgi:hypoxanthine-guanine phosphoribosyltransferase
MASSARRGVKDLVHAAETLTNERLNQKFLDGDSNVFFLCILVGCIMFCIEFRTRMKPHS